MTAYVALLRAVNVGGTGKLPMATLRQMCEEAGFAKARTYIASGNVVFGSEASEAEVKSALAGRLEIHAGRPVGVVIRSAEEMADVVVRNPFPDEPGNRTMVLFVDDPLPADAFHGVSGRQDELLVLGRREIYIFYGNGLGNSRLRIPAAAKGTTRNMTTVAMLAEMAAAD